MKRVVIHTCIHARARARTRTLVFGRDNDVRVYIESCRSGPGVHCIPRRRQQDGRGPTVGDPFLHHAHYSRSGQPGK